MRQRDGALVRNRIQAQCNGPEAQTHEQAVIIPADADSEPQAVMVKMLNTPLALVAVFGIHGDRQVAIRAVVFW